MQFAVRLRYQLTRNEHTYIRQRILAGGEGINGKSACSATNLFRDGLGFKT